MNELIVGAGAVTVKVPVLVPVPPAVDTAIFPVTAPAGNGIVNLVAEITVQPLFTANVPNFTEVAPARLVPLIVTAAPI